MSRLRYGTIDSELKFNERNTMEEFYLPEKWRNKVFRFQAGGYDGFGE